MNRSNPSPLRSKLPSLSLVAAAAALALAAAPTPADAHPLDLGYLRVDAESAALAVGLDLDVDAVAQLLSRDAEALAGAPDLAAPDAAALADITLRAGQLQSDLGACSWVDEPATAIANRTVSLTLRAECPAGARALRWAMPFLHDSRVSSTFQLLVKAQTHAGQQITTLDRNKTELTLALTGEPAAPSGFVAFLWSGVEHIGATPDQWHDADGWKLADGIDHVLFLLALLLAGGTVLQLASIATGFTLGHSVTLALSVLGVVRPPAAVIEPLIALSIALVAAEAFLRRPGNHRWKLATAFGLVHGFGFAGALNELGLSSEETAKALFGYNFGVEVGQLAIVLLLAPAILLLQRRPAVHHVVIRALSAAIFVAGVYWFAQRILGSL